MTIKTIPPQLFLGVQEDIPQSDIPHFADRAVGPLYELVSLAGIELAGDLHFMCPSFQGPEAPSRIQIAVPVNGEKPVPEPWHYWTSGEFTCAWTDHHGGVATIQRGWHDFVTGIEAEGGTVGKGWREIYKYWEAPDSAANVTELQRELLSP